MKIKNGWIVCLLAGFLVGAQMVSAEPLVFAVTNTIVTQDANPYRNTNAGRGTVDSAYITTSSAANYAAAADASKYDYVAIYQWDLNKPAEKRIESVNAATLKFRASFTASGNVCRYYRLVAPFDQSTVTWNTKPALDTSVYVEITHNTVNGQQFEVNVAPLLAKNGKMQTFGIAIFRVSGAANNYTHQLKGTDSWFRSYLTAEYTVPPSATVVCVR